ncbi:hypothetical protein DERP_007264, partial [Dermatophagoides pteronyssinus]
KKLLRILTTNSEEKKIYSKLFPPESIVPGGIRCFGEDDFEPLFIRCSTPNHQEPKINPWDKALSENESLKEWVKKFNEHIEMVDNSEVTLSQRHCNSDWPPRSQKFNITPLLSILPIFNPTVQLIFIRSSKTSAASILPIFRYNATKFFNVVATVGLTTSYRPCDAYCITRLCNVRKRAELSSETFKKTTKKDEINKSLKA